jgi:hypothetical protein
MQHLNVDAYIHVRMAAMHTWLLHRFDARWETPNVLGF